MFAATKPLTCSNLSPEIHTTSGDFTLSEVMTGNSGRSTHWQVNLQKMNDFSSEQSMIELYPFITTSPSLFNSNLKGKFCNLATHKLLSSSSQPFACLNNRQIYATPEIIDTQSAYLNWVMQKHWIDPHSGKNAESRTCSAFRGTLWESWTCSTQSHELLRQWHCGTPLNGFWQFDRRLGFLPGIKFITCSSTLLPTVASMTWLILPLEEMGEQNF